MVFKQVIDETRMHAARTKRRAAAVKEHGKTVLTTGIDTAKQVVMVAMRDLQAAVQMQKATLLEPELSVSARLRKLRSNAKDALATARTDITAALKEGYRSVTDRLAHLTAVTHKEQALENRIDRRAKKLRKAA